MPGSVITFAHHLQLKLSQFRGAIRAGHAFLQVDGDIGDTGIVEINDTSRTETQRTIKWMKGFCFLRRSHWQVSEGTLDHMRNSESIRSTISAASRLPPRNCIYLRPGGICLLPRGPALAPPEERIVRQSSPVRWVRFMRRYLFSPGKYVRSPTDGRQVTVANSRLYVHPVVSLILLHYTEGRCSWLMEESIH